MSPTYLYITPFFPSLNDWRGAYCLDFVKALKRQRPGMRVEVLVAGEGGDYEIEGVKVWRFKEKILKGFVLPFLFKRSNERSFLSAVKRAGVKIDDVVVCHGNTARFAIYPLAVKRLNPKIKTLLHHHDLASFGLNLGLFHRCSLYNVFLCRQMRALHEQIDCHVFISEASRRSFLAAPDADWTMYEDYKVQMRGPKMFGCRPAKIKESVILHNGVDEGLFGRVERVEHVDWEGEGINRVERVETCRGEGVLSRVERVETCREFAIGCVGNFEKLKDQMTLLMAVEILNRVEQLAVSGRNRRLSVACDSSEPSRAQASAERLAVRGDSVGSSCGERVKIKVVFIGSGEMMAECKSFATGNGIDAEFRQEVRHEELPEFYRELDLFVLPSYFEGFGCVFTEAWTCGVPFIACEGQGIEDLIAEEDRGKWLCKPRDAEDLAKKIEAYIENRWEQKLTGPVDVDTLVAKFCEGISV